MNNKLEIIEDIPIFYINLNRSPERNNNMINQLEGLNYTRVEAIDNKDLNMDTLKMEYTINEKMTINEVACILSHIKAINLINELNLDYAIIMEDDCNFSYLQYKKIPIKQLITEKPDLHIIQLACITTKSEFRKISKSNDLLIKMYTSGAMCYFINKKGIDNVLSYLKLKQLTVSENFIFGNTNTYVTKPYFTYYEREIYPSTIRNNTKGAMATQTISKTLWDEYYRGT